MEINIVFGKYTPPHFTGGIQTYIYFFTKYLSSKNINYKIISIKDGDKYIHSDNILKFSVPKIPILGPILFQFKINRKINSDGVINSQYPTIGPFLSKKFTVIQTVHTLSSDEGKFVKGSRNIIYAYSRKIIRNTLNRWLEKRSFNRATHIICLNQDLCDKIINYGIPRSKISIIPNGVDLEYFSYTPVNPFTDDRPIKLLYAGRLTPRKNLLTLFESLKHFDNNQFQLEVVGTGEQEGLLKRYVVENNLQNIIKFRGFKSGESLINAYRDCDIFVLPSFYEGVPFSVLEAMAIGRACIVGNFSNVENIINDGINGFIVKINSFEYFEQSLKNVLECKLKLSSFGENSRKFIEKFYSNFNSFNNTFELISKYDKDN